MKTSLLVATAALLASPVLISAQDIMFESCKPGTWALTFDDGPHTLTADLLKVLKEEKVKATFFVLGKQVSQPQLGALTKQAFDEGHQIASHTWDHKSLNIKDVEEDVRTRLGVPVLSEAERQQQMKDTERAIKQTIGRIPNYMRPPYGVCGPECQQSMKGMGYSIAMWTTDSNDWKYAGKPASVQRKIVKDVMRLDDGEGPEVTTAIGPISLQHDIQAHSVEHAREIIKNIKKLGFKFATVADCLVEGPPAYRDEHVVPEAETPIAGGPKRTDDASAPAQAPVTGSAQPDDDEEPVVVFVRKNSAVSVIPSIGALSVAAASLVAMIF